MIKLPQVLIQELVKRNLVAEEKIEEYAGKAQDQNKDFGRILVEQGLVGEEDLLKIKEEVYHLPVFDLIKYKTEINTELSKVISEDVINFYQIIPFAKTESVLRVGILNPEDINALEALKFIGEDKGLELERFLVSYKDFDRLLQSYSSITSEVGEALEVKSASETDASKPKLEIPKTGSLDQITADSPVTRVVAIMVKHAVENKASDIHIEPMDSTISVRFRIDGVLQSTLSLHKNLLSAIVTRIKILSEMKIDETRLPQDGRFSTYLDRKIDFRVSSLPTRHGEKIVMRILDPLVGNIDLPDLGLFGRSLDLVAQNIEKPFGEILITGPTGSGKSTTLYSVLKKYNKEGVNIITLEDPIEYFLEGINQSQVHEEIGYTFASGLRHILRQDPDVIMVGEIRDKETASLATNAALTGHVVLSTLHTNDAVGVIPRLIDMGVEKYLLAPTLNLVIAQRLLRKLCQKCKIEAKPNEAEKRIIDQALKTMPENYRQTLTKEELGADKIYKPALPETVCKECGGKTYRGRMAVVEILAMTNELEQIILTDFNESKIRTEAQRQGMISMFQDGVIKVLKGLTSLEELLQVAQENEENQDVKEEKKK